MLLIFVDLSHAGAAPHSCGAFVRFVHRISIQVVREVADDDEDKARPSLSANRIHRSFWLYEAGGVDFVTFFFGCHAGTNRVCDLIVGGVTTQKAADVGLFQAEETITQFSVGGDSDSIATHAKGLADGGDESDPTNSVVEFEFRRWSAVAARSFLFDRSQWYD